MRKRLVCTVNKFFFMLFIRNFSKAFLIASAFSLLFSCSDKKEETPAPVDPNAIVELSGNIATQTLVSSKKYLLKGNVFVQSGVVLTIQPGTIILGDKGTKGTLIINKGGKIEAVGTAESPIVFTSEREVGERDKGDWGGIIILGSANTNQSNPAIEGVSPAVNFGTQNSTANDNESSGTLKYVRIEFAGIALSPNNEINGLTFGSVGSGTVVENVQVSFSGDDAFEWFGGTVNCKNLVAYSTWDDDFDTDFGYTGKIQFALSVRDPFSADQSGSNAFESDNDAGGTAALPLTAPVFSNVTVFGPRYDSSSSVSGSYQHAAHLRRRTATSIFNSVITGFPIGLRIDGKTTFDNYTSGAGEVENNLLISLGNRTAPRPFMGGTNTTDDEVKTYFNAGNPAGAISFNHQLNYANLGLDVNLYLGKTPAYPSNPSFGVSSGVISSGADFTPAKLGGSFFQNVPFHGAFGASDWTDTWTNFDPKAVAY
jgi:hypothetical protein